MDCFVGIALCERCVMVHETCVTILLYFFKGDFCENVDGLFCSQDMQLEGGAVVRLCCCCAWVVFESLWGLQSWVLVSC